MSAYSEIEKKLKKNKYTWVVTGCAGFIGSHLTERLLNLEQNVIGIDNLSTGFQSNLDFFLNRKAFTFHQEDILSENIPNLLKGTDFILHQAALGSVPRSMKDPQATHQSNVTGFLNILKTATDLKIKRMVYASSSSVYGDNPVLPKKEDDVGRVLSPYAASKKMNEIYADVFFRAFGTPVLGLRYFNVFGPRQSPLGPYAAVIPIWIESALNQIPIQIFGDGKNSRDFSYIENVVQANLLAAFAQDSALGQVYNVACEEKSNLLQLAHMIQKYVVQYAPQTKGSTVVHLPPRAGDIAHSFADCSLAKSNLFYEPVIRLEEGIQRTVQFFIQTKKEST